MNENQFEVTSSQDKFISFYQVGCADNTHIVIFNALGVPYLVLKKLALWLAEDHCVTLVQSEYAVEGESFRLENYFSSLKKLIDKSKFSFHNARLLSYCSGASLLSEFLRNIEDEFLDIIMFAPYVELSDVVNHSSYEKSVLPLMLRGAEDSNYAQLIYNINNKNSGDNQDDGLGKGESSGKEESIDYLKRISTDYMKSANDIMLYGKALKECRSLHYNQTLEKCKVRATIFGFEHDEFVSGGYISSLANVFKNGSSVILKGKDHYSLYLDNDVYSALSEKLTETSSS